VTAPLDPTRARLDRELKHTSPLIGGRFDPAGRFLFVSAQDNTLQRFDLLTGAKASFAGHRSWVRGIAFVGKSDDTAGRLAVAGGGAVVPPKPAPFTVVTGDYHGNLVWWPGGADSPQPVRSVAAHAGWVRAVAVSPDGQTVASCGNDRLVKLWSAADGSPLGSLAGHDCHVYNLAFHPAGTRLASADLKGVVKDWDLAAGKPVRELDAGALHKYDPGFMADIGGARAMAFTLDGSRLGCAGITNVSNAFAGVGNPLVLVFDWTAGVPKPLRPKDAFQGTAWGLAFHPAGWVIAAGAGAGGRVWFWKGDEPASSHTVTVPAGVRDLALDPAGGRLAACGANGTAYVYSLPAGEPQAGSGCRP
jgi:WD40 repeat protein